MKLSLASASLGFFVVSVVFLILLTLFESWMTGLSMSAERLLGVLILVLPAVVGFVCGILSVIRKESGRWLGAVGLVLNALFALFHLFVLSFAG